MLWQPELTNPGRWAQAGAAGRQAQADTPCPLLSRLRGRRLYPASASPLWGWTMKSDNRGRPRPSFSRPPHGVCKGSVPCGKPLLLHGPPCPPTHTPNAAGVGWPGRGHGSHGALGASCRRSAAGGAGVSSLPCLACLSGPQMRLFWACQQPAFLSQRRHPEWVSLRLVGSLGWTVLMPACLVWGLCFPEPPC